MPVCIALASRILSVSRHFDQHSYCGVVAYVDYVCISFDLGSGDSNWIIIIFLSLVSVFLFSVVVAVLTMLLATAGLIERPTLCDRVNYF